MMDILLIGTMLFEEPRSQRRGSISPGEFEPNSMGGSSSLRVGVAMEVVEDATFRGPPKRSQCSIPMGQACQRICLGYVGYCQVEQETTSKALSIEDAAASCFL